MRSWFRQLAIVAATFTLFGLFTSVFVFWNAPRIWSGVILAGVAAGVGGGLGWLLVCGNQLRPAWWRTTLAGIFAGVVLHPVYLLLSSLLTGELMVWSDLFTGSMFFLLIGGIITVPAGIAAAVACRIAGGWWNPSAAEQSHALEPANGPVSNGKSPLPAQ